MGSEGATGGGTSVDRRRWVVVARIVACVLACAAGWPAIAAAEPSIEIISWPEYGTWGSVSGRVSGVDFATHHVAAYIQVEGGGWWTKPTFENLTVPIASDGTFSINVTTYWLDAYATIHAVVLLSEAIPPPEARGSGAFPQHPGFLDTALRHRHGPTVEFAGRTWAVKEAPAPAQVGPGANSFSADPSDVWVDGDGLHLTVRHRDDRWWSTEVFLAESLGYGTYAFQTNSRVDNLDIHVTFGAFTWDPFGQNAAGGSPHREIDFEDSRWGDPAAPNSQMVVQPFDVAGNLHRYVLPDQSVDPALTRFFTWEPDQIEFVTLGGHHAPFDYPESAVIERWVYRHDPDSGHFVPPAGDEAFRFNLWLNNPGSDGSPSPGPASGTDTEVVVNDFAFTPALIWESATGAWADAHWQGRLDLTVPAGGEVMVVRSGRVEMNDDRTGAAGAASLGLRGGLVYVSGTGQLEITGSVRVDEGAALAVDGTLAAGEVVIAPAGVLSGSGTIDAPTVTIGGVLSPGGSNGSLGKMTIDGSLTLGGGGGGGGLTFQSVTSGGSDAVLVPEPGASAMLAVLGLWLTLAATIRCRRTA
jgi:hypothetical protein